MEDTTESDPREVEAQKFNLNYVQMDGNIGCLVNGEAVKPLRSHCYRRALRRRLGHGHYGHH